MKKFTCVFAVLANLLMVPAQSVDHLENFIIGDQANYIKVVTSDSISPGKSGKKIKWDFSKLKTQGKEVKQVIQSSGPTEPGVKYQMVESNSDSSYVYLNRSNDTLYFTAYYDQAQNFLITYPEGVPFMVYPFTYGGKIEKKGITREYEAGNLKFTGTGYFRTSFDGTGELKLADVTYKNVVRIKFEQEFIDTDNKYKSKTLAKTITYAWFDPVTKHSVLKIDYSYIRSAYYNQTTYEYSILNKSTNEQ